MNWGLQTAVPFFCAESGQKKSPAMRRIDDLAKKSLARRGMIQLIAANGLSKEFNGFNERTIAVAIEGTERPFGGDTACEFPVMRGASSFIDGAILTDFDID